MVFGANVVEYFASGTAPASLYVFKTLPDSLVCINPSCNVEKTLICFRVLYNCYRFAIQSQYDRPFRFLKLLQNCARIVTKTRQRPNIFGGVHYQLENSMFVWIGVQLQLKKSVLFRLRL
jgi:hypothetical protein